MGTKRDFSTYVSGGQFEADIKKLYPEGPFSAASKTTDEELEELAASYAPAAKRELLAFAALARAGKLPRMGRENQPVGLEIHWDPGYSPYEDFGDELEETFEDTGTPYELAKTAIGLGTTGAAGVMHFILADGHIAVLDMGAYSEWQWSRFANLGEYCWFVFHGKAASAGRFPVSEYKAAVSAHGCARTARSFEVKEEVLPPLPDHDDEPPAWLR